MSTFTVGGNAVGAAIAANAALAVTAPHLWDGRRPRSPSCAPAGEVVGLNATGRAGSGPIPRRCGPSGSSAMPLRHDTSMP